MTVVTILLDQCAFPVNDLLFVFVMMLINLEQFQNNRERGKVKLVLSILATLIILGVFSLIVNNNIEVLTVTNLADNSMKVLFEKLFTTYYLPFEMATVLLLAALVACIVITGHEKALKEEQENLNE